MMQDIIRNPRFYVEVGNGDKGKYAGGAEFVGHAYYQQRWLYRYGWWNIIGYIVSFCV